MVKTFLFVDGSNLYGSQFELYGPERYLDFIKFIDQISEVLQVKFSRIFFYASYSPKPAKPTKKQISYLQNEGLFYRNVKKTPNTVFFKGYRSKTSGKEKEVDVKLAVDIVDFAHRNKYQNMYLLSGDADFLHALLAAKSLGKNISIICMPNNILYRALIHFKTIILNLGEKLPHVNGYMNKPDFIELDVSNLTIKI